MAHRPIWPSPDPAGYVLDSSAVLALLWREAGAEAVAQVAMRSVLTATALSECLTKALQRGGDEIEARARLRMVDWPVVAWTDELAWDSVDLCPLAWTHGLSLADRACLATARALGRTAITADAAWPRAVRTLRRKVRVQLIR